MDAIVIVKLKLAIFAETLHPFVSIIVETASSIKLRIVTTWKKEDVILTVQDLTQAIFAMETSLQIASQNVETDTMTPTPFILSNVMTIIWMKRTAAQNYVKLS